MSGECYQNSFSLSSVVLANNQIFGHGLAKLIAHSNRDFSRNDKKELLHWDENFTLTFTSDLRFRINIQT